MFKRNGIFYVSLKMMMLHCIAGFNVSEEGEVVGKIRKLGIDLISMNVTEKLDNTNKKWSLTLWLTKPNL